MKLIARVVQFFLAPLFYLGFRFGLIKRKPRIQHYVFAHKLLPRTLFDDPVGVVMPLVVTATDRSKPEGVELLRALWNEADVEREPHPVIEWDPSGYKVTCLSHPNNMVIVIPLPEPLHKAEAYYAVMVVDSPGMAVGHIRQLRYFVLEHLGMRGGLHKTYLSEWSPKGPEELEYKIHFENVQPTVPEVLSKIESLLPAKLPI